MNSSSSLVAFSKDTKVDSAPSKSEIASANANLRTGAVPVAFETLALGM